MCTLFSFACSGDWHMLHAYAFILDAMLRQLHDFCARIHCRSLNKPHGVVPDALGPQPNLNLNRLYKTDPPARYPVPAAQTSFNVLVAR